MNERQDTEIGQLPGEWELKTLLDVASPTKKAIISGPFGSNISRKYFVESGVPVIRGNNLDLDIGTKFVDDGFVFVTEEKAESLNTWATVNDLVFTAAGTIGQVGLITGNQKYSHYIISNKQLRATLDHKKINPLFAYYWFASDLVQQLIVRRNTGSTIPLINLSVLKSLPVPLPSLREQEAITAVLASLDDKIDLLHRQNKTLESLAQTLFRHWFIDGAEDDWEVGTLNDVLTAVGGTTPSTKSPEFWDGDIHWTTPRDLSNNDGPYLLDTARKITESGLAKISSGLLPKGTLLLSSRAPVGYLGFSDVPIAINQGYIAILDDKGFSKHFIYLWLKENMDYVKSYAGGTTFMEISKSSFRTLEIAIPPVELREDFERIIVPLFQKIRANTHQIVTLEKLRDTLLPKLMSGEVRVRLRQQN